MSGNVVIDFLVLMGLAALGVEMWLLSRKVGPGVGGDLGRLTGEVDRLGRLIREDSETSRTGADDRARALREEVRTNLAEARKEDAARADALRSAVEAGLANHAKAQGEVRDTLSERLAQFETKQVDQGHKLAAALSESGDKLREHVRAELEKIRSENEAKLEQIRKTVDEQLQSTLEKRLGESFTLVTDQLQKVALGLGEMQALASGVGDLKRVLTNVKPRGVWGEAQLESLLLDFLTEGQFERNWKPRPSAGSMVEFAIKLPRGGGERGYIYLPIDAKFPREDFERLVLASEQADAEGVKAASDALARAVKKCAGDIKAKYIEPPATTEYAIMFLPSEALYAEVARQPAVLDAVIREYRVVIAGPSTLAALLSTFRMAFQSLRIQEQAGEIANVLQGVQSEFTLFESAISKVMDHATKTVGSIEKLQTRQRVMGRKLKGVDLLRAESGVDAARMLLDFEGAEANDSVAREQADDDAA